jgi:hypothetical protein
MSANDPAFPLHPDIQEPWMNGLTKREYFAAMAMQGLLASFNQHDVTNFTEFASDAFLMADAMIEASKVQS